MFGLWDSKLVKSMFLNLTCVTLRRFYKFNEGLLILL